MGQKRRLTGDAAQQQMLEPAVAIRHRIHRDHVTRELPNEPSSCSRASSRIRPSMTISASAGPRTSLVRHFTTSIGAPCSAPACRARLIINRAVMRRNRQHRCKANASAVDHLLQRHRRVGSLLYAITGTPQLSSPRRICGRWRVPRLDLPRLPESHYISCTAPCDPPWRSDRYMWSGVSWAPKLGRVSNCARIA
jgi:hypothetical protein